MDVLASDSLNSYSNFPSSSIGGVALSQHGAEGELAIHWHSSTTVLPYFSWVSGHRGNLCSYGQRLPSVPNEAW